MLKISQYEDEIMEWAGTDPSLVALVAGPHLSRAPRCSFGIPCRGRVAVQLGIVGGVVASYPAAFSPGRRAITSIPSSVIVDSVGTRLSAGPPQGGETPKVNTSLVGHERASPFKGCGRYYLLHFVGTHSTHPYFRGYPTTHPPPIPRGYPWVLPTHGLFLGLLLPLWETSPLHCFRGSLELRWRRNNLDPTDLT